MSLDPITIEVMTSRLREVAATMEHALYHSGYSPILRESRDGTAGLTDADGRVLIVGGGLQYHSLPYQQAVRGVVERYGREGMRPGDSFIVNNPYICGNPHVPDMCAVTPAFYQGRLIGFGVSIAHKADIGGIVPGSSGAAAREIFHDGLLLPPVRYQTNAGVNDEVEAIIRNNSRIPDIVIGDLRGQVGCTRLGTERLAALCDEYGVEKVLAVMESILALTARRLRTELKAWTDGVATAEGFLDHDGAVRDKPVRIAVRAQKSADRLVLDFSESAPQTLGPVNVNGWTTRAVSLLAVLASTDPSIPMNSGLLDAVEFVLPPGLVVSPQHPATVNHYFPSAVMVYSTVLSALGKLNPARAVAPSGLATGALAIGYRQGRTGKATVQYEIGSTGLGGTAGHDGTSIVQPMNHITPGTPVEILETEYPLQVRRFDVWRDSAGAGHHRGGVGYVREYELQEDCILTSRGSNHVFPSWGLAGGGSPPVARTTINPERPNEERLGPIETRQLKAGDVIRLERSGGGGYGPAWERPAEAVLADVLDGYVSLDAAREQYGVVVDAGTHRIDQAATQRRRDEIKRRAST
jgi:N-methylhydantoinase B